MRYGTRQDAFVGRQPELDTLLTRLDAACQGAGGLVLLGGEPGIGKTRLAEELAGAATARGVRVLWGRCYEGEGAPAFWPWVQILCATVRGQDATALHALLGPGAADLAPCCPT